MLGFTFRVYLVAEKPSVAATSTQKTAATLATASAARSFTVPAISPTVSPGKTPTMENGGESLPKRIKIDSADFQAFSAKSKPEMSRTAHVPTSDDEEYEEVPFVNGETQAPKVSSVMHIITSI